MHSLQSISVLLTFLFLFREFVRILTEYRIVICNGTHFDCRTLFLLRDLSCSMTRSPELSASRYWVKKVSNVIPSGTTSIIAKQRVYLKDKRNRWTGVSGLTKKKKDSQAQGQRLPNNADKVEQLPSAWSAPVACLIQIVTSHAVPEMTSFLQLASCCM